VVGIAAVAYRRRPNQDTDSDEDEGNIEMESIGDDDESVDGRDNNLDYESDGSTEDLEDEPLD
jgi:hypothetical protein